MQVTSEAMMPKTLTLRLDDEVYDLFSQAAKAENRSLANLIETAALAQVRELQFADDYEMADILADEKLLRRLKSGSRDARLGKGRFVE
jgi:predicted transcriptional regulator